MKAGLRYKNARTRGLQRSKRTVESNIEKEMGAGDRESTGEKETEEK